MPRPGGGRGTTAAPQGLQLDFVDLMCARFGWTRAEVEAARRAADRRGPRKSVAAPPPAARRATHPPGVLPFAEFAEPA